MSEKFKQVIVELPPIERQSEQVIFWPFQDGVGPDDIAKTKDGKYAIKKGCGCVAEITVNKEGVFALYEDQGGKNDKEFGKVIRVFFKDDLTPLMVKNQNGVEVFNIQRPNQLLQFKGSYINLPNSVKQ